MKKVFPFLLGSILLLALVYAPITHIGFAKFDDEWMLLDEALVQSKIFDMHFMENVFTRINGLQYSPLTTLYYYLVYQLNGYDAYYYHLVALFIHCLNTGLSFMLAKKLLEVFSVRNAAVISFTLAIIWMVLPFNVESVVWISASKILLFTFFGNISLIWFINAYIDNKKLLYLGSLVAFTLSFLAKEQAVLFPLVMLLFVYCHQLKIQHQLNFKKMVSWTFAFMVLALAFGVLTAYVSIYGDGTHGVDRYPFSQRFVLSFYCLFFYIFKCFVPTGLHYHYPFPIKLGQALPLMYYLFPVLITAVGWFGYKQLKFSINKHLYLFLWGVFLIHMLLVIQIVPLARASMLADRYMYASSFGLLLFMLVWISEKFELSFARLSKVNSAIIIFFLTYVIVLSFYSNYLIQNWKALDL